MAGNESDIDQFDFDENLTTMPFGRYKGHSFEDIPTDYLQWCLENFDPVDNYGLYEEIEAEYRKR